MKNYYIELEPLEKKEATGYSGPNRVCAHFRSKHEPATRPFVWDMQCAIDFYYNQNKRYWNGKIVGDLYVQAEREKVTASCPSYFEGHRTKPIYKKVH